MCYGDNFSKYSVYSSCYQQCALHSDDNFAKHVRRLNCYKQSVAHSDDTFMTHCIFFNCYRQTAMHYALNRSIKPTSMTTHNLCPLTNNYYEQRGKQSDGNFINYVLNELQLLWKVHRALQG